MIRSSKLLFLNTFSSLPQQVKLLQEQNDKLTRENQELKKQYLKQQAWLQQLEHDQVRLFLGQHVKQLNDKFQSFCIEKEADTDTYRDKRGYIEYEVVPNIFRWAYWEELYGSDDLVLFKEFMQSKYGHSDRTDDEWKNFVFSLGKLSSTDPKVIRKPSADHVKEYVKVNRLDLQVLEFVLKF